MRIPLTKYGLPQVAVFPGILVGVIMAVSLCGSKVMPCGAVIAIDAVLAVILVWVLSFFRDPVRIICEDGSVLLSPADGTITDIEIVDDNPELKGPHFRIGIFLSIFNVHINRTPCAVTIEKVSYREGKYINAMNPLAGKVNEANDVFMRRREEPKDLIMVRQVSGAVARRIVCEAGEGKEFAGGERFGMLKFGSRTELYVPIREKTKYVVKVKDKVKAGLTILVRYDK